MPIYHFECPVHGKQERFRCKIGQDTIQCESCDKVIPRSKELHRAGFTVNGEGACDAGKYKPK